MSVRLVTVIRSVLPFPWVMFRVFAVVPVEVTTSLVPLPWVRITAPRKTSPPPVFPRVISRHYRHLR